MKNEFRCGKSRLWGLPLDNFVNNVEGFGGTAIFVN